MMSTAPVLSMANRVLSFCYKNWDGFVPAVDTVALRVSRTSAPMAKLLADSPDWRLVYIDAMHVIFRRAASEAATAAPAITADNWSGGVQWDDVDSAELERRVARGRAARPVPAARIAQDSAEQAYEITQTRVSNGAATQLELTSSRIARDQAKVGYYSAVYDLLAARFDWEQATGSVP